MTWQNIIKKNQQRDYQLAIDAITEHTQVLKKVENTVNSFFSEKQVNADTLADLLDQHYFYADAIGDVIITMMRKVQDS